MQEMWSARCVVPGLIEHMEYLPNEEMGNMLILIYRDMNLDIFLDF